MLKRILALMSVVAVVLICALPCFAAGTDGFGTLKYSGFPIDMIWLNNGDAAGRYVEWPYNVASNNTWIETNAGAFFIGTRDSLVDGIYGDFLIGDCTSFTLTSRITYVDGHSHFKLAYSDTPTDITFSRVKLSFDLLVLKSPWASRVHRTETVHVSYDSVVDGLQDDHEVDVISYIFAAYENQLHEDPLLNYRLILQNFRITVDFTYDSDPGAFRNIGVEIGATDQPFTMVDGWFDSLQIRKTAADSDDFSLGWLADVAYSFLQIEIFPGFQFDALLKLVIISLAVMFLLKLIS